MCRMLLNPRTGAVRESWGALDRELADEWLTSAMNTSVVDDEDIRDDLTAAVVLLMANVVSSEDLVEQVTPKHFESPKNLVSKEIINGFR